LVGDGEEVADVLDPVPVEPEPAVDEVGLLAEPLAAAWKASKVLFAVGLTAKTMPCPQ
jgi:hypothetical protein